MSVIEFEKTSSLQPGDEVRLYTGQGNGNEAIFDLSALHGGHKYSVCTNITPGTAKAIIDELYVLFPHLVPEPVVEPEPETRKPDIILPSLFDNQPAVVRVNVAGLFTFVLCNWLDYKGWEVRRDATSMDHKNLLLGWLRNVGDPGALTATSISIRTRGEPRGFDRIDDALLWLVKVA